jgi:hypothetical protein
MAIVSTPLAKLPFTTEDAELDRLLLESSHESPGLPPEGMSTNLVFPEGRRSSKKKLEPTPLQVIARQALRSRPPARLQMRFPALRRYYAKARLDPITGSFKPGKSYQRDIHSYLVVWGFRVLNDTHAAGKDLPSTDALEELFLEMISTKAIVWGPHGGRGPGLSTDDPYDVALSAALAVARDWDPGYITERARQGRIGGLRSKRGPTFTLEMLEPHKHLSPKEQSIALGCSVPTIRRIHERARGGVN